MTHEPDRDDSEFDQPFICPVTGQICMGEVDEFCEDYGCARKAGIDVNTAPKRDFLFVACDAGHDWQSIGGCNAGCHDNCACSVPVNTCSRCGDCDYGDNEDAKEVRAECAILWGDQKERFSATEETA